MNTLYYGDNLSILREYIKDESVDLIYLDPPYTELKNEGPLIEVGVNPYLRAGFCKLSVKPLLTCGLVHG